MATNKFAQIIFANCNPKETVFWKAGAVIVKDLLSAIASIKVAYRNNHNNPVDVVLDGHGNPGDFEMGDGEHLEQNNDNVKKFWKELRGKVKQVYLFACQVGAGFTGDPSHVMRALGNGLVCCAVPRVRILARDKDLYANWGRAFRKPNYETDNDCKLIVYDADYATQVATHFPVI